MCFKISLTFVVFAVIFASINSQESSENVQLTGGFRVVGQNEELPVSNGFVTEHPFFQLEAMKIARAYLDRQYAKERAQQFGA